MQSVSLLLSAVSPVWLTTYIWSALHRFPFFQNAQLLTSHKTSFAIFKHPLSENCDHIKIDKFAEHVTSLFSAVLYCSVMAFAGISCRIFGLFLPQISFVVHEKAPKVYEPREKDKESCDIGGKYGPE